MFNSVKSETEPEVCAIVHALQVLGNFEAVCGCETAGNVLQSVVDDEVNLLANFLRLVIAVAIKVQIGKYV
jgi:hypothetical protein